jgi:hypothetical protein
VSPPPGRLAYPRRTRRSGRCAQTRSATCPACSG